MNNIQTDIKGACRTACASICITIEALAPTKDGTSQMILPVRSCQGASLARQTYLCKGITNAVTVS
jgi:hypothetical protein